MRRRRRHGRRLFIRESSQSIGIRPMLRPVTSVPVRGASVTLRATPLISQASSVAEQPIPSTTTSFPANGSGVR
jgi:hypothetical protein